jgi:hypothetical protein
VTMAAGKFQPYRVHASGLLRMTIDAGPSLVKLEPPMGIRQIFSVANPFRRRGDLNQLPPGDLPLYERQMGAGFVFVRLIGPGAHFPVAISIDLGRHLFLGPSRLRGTDDKQEEQDQGTDGGSSIGQDSSLFIDAIVLPDKLNGPSHTRRKRSFVFLARSRWSLEHTEITE